MRHVKKNPWLSAQAVSNGSAVSGITTAEALVLALNVSVGTTQENLAGPLEEDPGLWTQLWLTFALPYLQGPGTPSTDKVLLAATNAGAVGVLEDPKSKQLYVVDAQRQPLTRGFTSQERTRVSAVLRRQVPSPGDLPKVLLAALYIIFIDGIPTDSELQLLLGFMPTELADLGDTLAEFGYLVLLLEPASWDDQRPPGLGQWALSKSPRKVTQARVSERTRTAAAEASTKLIKGRAPKSLAAQQSEETILVSAIRRLPDMRRDKFIPQLRSRWHVPGTGMEWLAVAGFISQGQGFSPRKLSEDMIGKTVHPDNIKIAAYYRPNNKTPYTLDVFTLSEIEHPDKTNPQFRGVVDSSWKSVKIGVPHPINERPQMFDDLMNISMPQYLLDRMEMAKEAEGSYDITQIPRSQTLYGASETKVPTRLIPKRGMRSLRPLNTKIIQHQEKTGTVTIPEQISFAYMDPAKLARGPVFIPILGNAVRTGSQRPFTNFENLSSRGIALLGPKEVVFWGALKLPENPEWEILTLTVEELLKLEQEYNATFIYVPVRRMGRGTLTAAQAMQEVDTYGSFLWQAPETSEVAIAPRRPFLTEQEEAFLNYTINKGQVAVQSDEVENLLNEADVRKRLYEAKNLEQSLLAIQKMYQKALIERLPLRPITLELSAAKLVEALRGVNGVQIPDIDIRRYPENIRSFPRGPFRTKDELVTAATLAYDRAYQAAMQTVIKENTDLGKALRGAEQARDELRAQRPRGDDGKPLPIDTPSLAGYRNKLDKVTKDIAAIRQRINATYGEKYGVMFTDRRSLFTLPKDSQGRVFQQAMQDYVKAYVSGLK